MAGERVPEGKEPLLWRWAADAGARVGRAFPALFWIALLLSFCAGVAPAGEAPALMPWDKAQHFVAFYVLSVLGALAYPRRSLLAIGAWVAAFGALIELVQALPVVHRDPDFWDWSADVLAIASALATATLGRWRDRLASGTSSPQARTASREPGRAGP